MSPDNESCAMKGSRPPPPVPPRPSRSVVKEALAKTRQAYGMVHGSTGSRVSLSEKNPDEFLNRQTIPLTNHQLQQYNMGQPRFSLGNQNAQINQKSVPCYPSEKLSNNYGMRPVVYQSQNCRNRPVEDNKTTSTKNIYISNIDKRPSQLVGKSSFKEDLLKNEQNSEKAQRDTSCDNPPNRAGPKLVDVEPKYANILEQKNGVNKHDGNLSRKPSNQEDITSNSSFLTNSNIHENLSGKNWDDILNDRNHVNTLIDEMFASVLEVNLGSSISPSSSNESIAHEAPNKITISHNTPQLATKPTNNNSDDENLTVIVINEDPAVSESPKSSTSTSERKVTFNDRENHEFLIEELQSMQHHPCKVSKRQHLGSLDSVNGVDKIHMNDWYGVNDGKKVRLSSCHITIEDPCEDGDQISKRNQKINDISRAYRLPPLPKSLSGFKFLDNSEGLEINESMQSDEKVQFSYSELKVDVSGREQTNLDRQLALLRREMVSLREQDLSLLSKLWFLSESIHDFRQMMQEQDDDKINARLSPSPSPSSIDDEDYYVISASTC